MRVLRTLSPREASPPLGNPFQCFLSLCSSHIKYRQRERESERVGGFEKATHTPLWTTKAPWILWSGAFFFFPNALVFPASPSKILMNSGEKRVTPMPEWLKKAGFNLSHHTLRLRDLLRRHRNIGMFAKYRISQCLKIHGDVLAISRAAPEISSEKSHCHNDSRVNC